MGSKLVKTEVVEDLKTEVAEDSKTEVAEDSKTEVAENSKTEIVEDLKTEVAENSKTEIVEDLKTEVAENSKTEIVEDLKTEVVENLKTEVVENLKTEVVENLKTEVVEDFIKSFPKSHITPSTNLLIFTRVLKEIEDTNNDFHSLRTKIISDPEEHINLFYFVMYPNDGAMAHLPIYGRMIIPNTYPTTPPVLHLFNITKRYNVDVFSSISNSNPVILESSMCFDILKSNGGTWKSNFSISCLFASLMQALVSYMVAQQYGPDIAEFVTIEKLYSIKKYADIAHSKYSKYFPDPPKIPIVFAKPCYAKSLYFPEKMETIDKQIVIYSSSEIYLQSGNESNNVTLSLDLGTLRNDIVFSVILSNSKTDMTGKENNTILLRNGITGTAAKKKQNDNTKWFYHGIPLVSDKGIKITITIANDQFTIVYWNDNKPIIHGDTPISYLMAEQIGNVKNIPFYLNIFLKKKKANDKNVTITTFKTDSGFIQA
jgi:ubiquitin-protein ligase